MGQFFYNMLYCGKTKLLTQLTQDEDDDEGVVFVCSELVRQTILVNLSWFPNSLIASKLNLALCQLPEEAEFVPLWVVCDGKDAQVRFCNSLMYA